MGLVLLLFLYKMCDVHVCVHVFTQSSYSDNSVEWIRTQ